MSLVPGLTQSAYSLFGQTLRMDDLPKLLGFVLLIGFGGGVIVATTLAAISKAIWKTRFSWRVVFGISTALAVLNVIACFLWIACVGSRTC